MYTLKVVYYKLLKIQSHVNLPWVHVRSHKNLGPISSAVLTFIGYKLANRQAKYMFIIGKIKDMKEEWKKMLFCRVYIKNYLANYNSYFPLKVKGLILEKYLYTCTETLLELVFLINFVLSQNPITQRKFKTDE